MIRLKIVVEGQTEEAFVKEILQKHQRIASESERPRA